MDCPKCGGKVHAQDTVHTPENETYRRRKCAECGFMFYTVEYEVEYDKQVQKIWRECHRIYKVNLLDKQRRANARRNK